jgi:hypothetical protein
VPTKSKSALHKIVKITHEIINALKFQLHPSCYMDNQKILPSTETIRHFHERALALCEPSHTGKNVSHRLVANQDISLYQANEVAPTDSYFKNILTPLLSLAAQKPDALATTRRYLGQWARWLKVGLSTIEGFENAVQTHLPSISSCWILGARVFTLGNRQ